MRRLEVRLDWGSEEVPVGTLAELGRRIHFEFHEQFLASPLPISPFHLPVRPGLHEDTDRTFGGLHGVFNDSLPDGWGLLLMDRDFRQQGIDTARITPLDRLAWMHSRGMGALTYHPAAHAPEDTRSMLDLTQLSQEAERVYLGSAEDVLPELRLAGGSPGGARPKVAVGYHQETGEMISGTAELPPGFRHYLIKFDVTADALDSGPVEFAYSLMARRAGIEVSATRLFQTRDGHRYFGTERFDRPGEGRLHVHTLGGLLHASHRLPSVGYDGLIKATHALTRDHRQLLEAYRRMVFNVFAHNRDDHVKNFAFLMSQAGDWRLAPAYDLTFSTGISGWHTMDVAGEAQDPDGSDMLRVADTVGLATPEARLLIEQVRDAVNAWPEFAAEAGLDREAAESIGQKLARQGRRAR